MDELAIVNAIVARLIPSDESGPGAPEAQAGRYIQRALEAEYAAHVQTYRAGVHAIDTYARSAHGAPFADLDPALQDAILVRVEHRVLPPEVGLPGEFFNLVRQHAIEGMFGDPHWGGNADGVGWDLIGYPGPRATWTAAEQEIEFLPTAEQS